MQHFSNKKIVIVGGGFGGIQCALKLAQKRIPNVKITLISNKPHFEYHPAIYRVVTGRSPLEICIPLREIFSKKHKPVEVLEDTIIKVNLEEKNLEGASGSHYNWDFLVLALGSETVYFNIPGFKDFSFGFKSIQEALILKKHLHESFGTAKDASQEEKLGTTNLVIVGGGASGTELAGELTLYAKQLAQKHGIDPSLVTTELIEAAPRLLPALPKDVSEKVQNHLRRLGVNIFLNRAVTKEEIENLYLRDMEMKTKTVIWTAGMKPNHLYSQIEKLSFDKKGRVVVDEFLQPKDHPNVFVIGDAASTIYSGMAQTAVDDGNFVSSTIKNKIFEKPLKTYSPKRPIYAIPVGSGWAVVAIGKLKLYGKAAWWLRRLADLKYFLSILPIKKAFLVFMSNRTICESCRICNPKGNY